MGETFQAVEVKIWLFGPFSILERIDVGETNQRYAHLQRAQQRTFSILERIDVGETAWVS